MLSNGHWKESTGSLSLPLPLSPSLSLSPFDIDSLLFTDIPPIIGVRERFSLRVWTVTAQRVDMTLTY
jgi:hypothetical protein